MAIIDSAIYEQTLNEIELAPRPAHYTYELDIHIGGSTTITMIKIGNIDGMDDFESGYSGTLTVTGMVMRADYTRFIYPSRSDLTATLRRYAIGELVPALNLTEGADARTYRAYLTNNSDRSLQGEVSIDEDHAEFEVSLQLDEFALEHLRFKTVGTVGVNKNAHSLLIGIYTALSRGLSLPDFATIDGCTAVQPDMTIPSRQIVIPQSIKFVDLPGFLQVHGGGIYNNGLGVYLKGRQWFIYPLYDHARYDREQRTLDIVIIPPTRLMGGERTYMVKGRKIAIIAQGDVQQRDHREKQYLNDGSGVRFSLASQLLDNYVTVSGNRAVTNPGETNAAFSFIQRATGINYAPFSKNAITDNVANEMSDLSRKRGQVIRVTWVNADEALLFPGMPVRVLYGREDGTYAVVGTLLACERFTILNNGNRQEIRYKTTLSLIVFVNESSKL